MANIDVFNGDADGICALLQLRLANPVQSQLVTGVKRDINLLDKVSASSADKIIVLDVSLDKNRKGLESALEQGAEVLYFDHHFSGEIPVHPKLNTHIDLASDICTSILVNNYLDGQFIEWAIVGAFGDNLKKSALTLSSPLNYSEADIQSLENLGTYINYNGYGADLDDLHFTPTDLYQRLSQFKNPLDFINNSTEDFNKLSKGYHDDMACAEAVEAHFQNTTVAVFMLPNERWARRVSGVYGNSLANLTPARAHAVLTLKPNNHFLVSIRAPLQNKVGADEFCRQFATGGGRAAAAGINDLPSDQLETFIEKFRQFYHSKR